MNSKSKYNFTEAQLGSDFANDKRAAFKKLIEEARSFTVISMPGVGVSYFLRYLAMQSFARSPSLRSGVSGRALFYHIDLYSLSSLNQIEFYKLLLTELGGKTTKKTAEEILTDIKKILVTISKKETKIVLIFSRFDQLKKEFNNQFLSNIQSLSSISAGKIVLIFTSIKPVPEISVETLNGGNLNFFSEILYFPPYSKEDLQKLITIEPIRSTPKETLDQMLNLAGGHNQLLQILRRSQKQQNLLLDYFVKLQMKGLLDYLDYYLRKQIQKIAMGKKIDEVDDYLLGVGMVKKIGSNYQLFTPLLVDYLKTHLPVKLPVKEAKLFKLLKQNMGKVVSKDEIFKEVWPEEDEGATDWALDALIYRLRKHPFMQSHHYIIESHKKVGYILIQA